ncbi:transposase [Streptomyces sp. NPDC051993]|uniref:IS110 family transposase n=1 Tax=Streptomyces sp. NPDC051993 TaxID=3155286 RepID=UPI00341B6B4F
MSYCGIDWTEKTHDVALVDHTGQLLAEWHITDDAPDYKILLDLLAEYGGTEDAAIPVAIETSRAFLVAVLRTGKRKVFQSRPRPATTRNAASGQPIRYSPASPAGRDTTASTPQLTYQTRNLPSPTHVQ